MIIPDKKRFFPRLHSALVLCAQPALLPQDSVHIEDTAGSSGHQIDKNKEGKYMVIRFDKFVQKRN